jgi:membrane associated rhomboid family serine protease
VERLPFFQRPFRYRYYNAALIIVGINVLVFMITYLYRDAIIYLSMIPVAVIGRNWWWQLLTYMFVHDGIWHVAVNMLAVFFFGVQLERRLGSDEFLMYYLMTGVVAGALSLGLYWMTGAYQVLLLGASGAVFGVLLGFATYFPTARIFIFGIFPVRAAVLVLGYTAIELLSMFSRTGGNVAHFTHLAGFLVAYVYLWGRLRINPGRVLIDSLRQ